MSIATLTMREFGVAGAVAKAQGASSKVWNTELSGHILSAKVPKSSSQGRILVVDDAGPPREILRASLSMSGFFVPDARNGWEALSMLREYSFDLVLLATKMLRVSCTEACRRIRWESRAPVAKRSERRSINNHF
jgi:PleD family two-component response regulator